MEIKNKATRGKNTYTVTLSESELIELFLALSDIREDWKESIQEIYNESNETNIDLETLRK